MQQLKVYQSTWAMERRRPDGAEWPLRQKLDMIVGAGFDGVGLRFADRAFVAEVTARLRDAGLTWQEQCYPRTVDDLKPVLALLADFVCNHINLQADVRPHTVAECVPLITGWQRLAADAGVALNLETHRDRMTTDLFFTLRLLDRLPGLRLTGDLSHYLVGRDCATLLVAALPHLPAQAFPERTVSLLVPFGPGGSTDLIARALAQEMSKTLGQQVVVLNKAGAGGAIGVAEVANAKPDENMLGMLPVGPLTTQPALRKLSYTPASFEPVCRVYSNPQFLLVRRDEPHRTLQDLVADAKRNPGKLNYASTRTGPVPHLALASLSSAAGLDVVHVPYKGEADMLQSLLSGGVTMFLGHPTLLSLHAQTMRGIAVLAPNRLKEYPELPSWWPTPRPIQESSITHRFRPDPHRT